MAILIEGPDVLGYSPNFYILATSGNLSSTTTNGPAGQHFDPLSRRLRSEGDQFVGKIGPMVGEWRPELWARLVNF